MPSLIGRRRRAAELPGAGADATPAAFIRAHGGGAVVILLVLAVLVAMLAVMTVGWLVRALTDNAGWIDVFWTFGTGAAAAPSPCFRQRRGARAWREAAGRRAWC